MAQFPCRRDICEKCRLEQNQSRSALFWGIEGGFFSMKNPLGGRGFGTHRLWFFRTVAAKALTRGREFGETDGCRTRVQ